ncbi:MAG: DUF1538 domain-containing protein [Acholeplasmatales bacterium]|nr:DUF1538 domain-containing protein [Acholeplasmatales bacterium]
MLKQLWLKLKESLISVLPVTVIVLILYFTPLVNLTAQELIVFLVSALMLIIGISFFNLGADMAMSIMGEQVGSALIKSKKPWLIVLVLFMLGLLITIAEPDLQVLANQIGSVVNPYLLIAFVGIGVGIFLVLAVIKIIVKADLTMMIIFFYMVMFAVTALVLDRGAGNFLSLAYDSGGVTTGPITVPFIMALGLGIAMTVGGRGAKENSFGLVALCSIGPILAVLLLGLTIDASDLNSQSLFDLSSYNLPENIIAEFGYHMLETMGKVAVALGLVVIFFLIINFFFIHLQAKKLKLIFSGIGYTYIGLVIFLTAAEFGFLSIGFKMGTQMGQYNEYLTTIFGLVIGAVVVLAEPAVHVLTKQVEEVTMGGVTKKSMLIALSAGVGISIFLSLIRIIFDFSILYYLIPGYLLSLGLSFFVPKVYTSIAFDSGGVASGPLTSSFILPFAIGVCSVINPNNLLNDAFGVVAMVALTPLITIQLLGFKSEVRLKYNKIKRTKMLKSAKDDEQIIYF